MGLAFRRQTDREDMEVSLRTGVHGLPLAVVCDLSQENNPVVQFTYDELKWFCFTVGPDLLRTMEADESS